ncbi:hypothetical protein ABEW34_29670 [Paenibacillus algorifonticola]|uniref:hypothetical protein n=1 Tax=Paenibacillus algorifonticola TaxID=684063 RepID=UPI003D2C1DE4
MNKIIMSNDWNENFIRDIFINKSRILKCINIISTKEGVSFDDVCMIATYSTYDDGDDERCEVDEVVLSKEFPGYPEELSYIKYNAFLKLIEDGLEEVISRFSNTETEEILKAMSEAEKIIL